eukprot:358951-Chlamydomonas_euryale.AAC.6
MSPAATSARKTELAVWLREGLVKLGPTFIKIGQQFSTRVDVLAPEFIKELEMLQDNVPPFDSETAMEILRSNLGKEVDQVFESFNPKPIAAASLGQVHLARVDGQKVVVKIQRPGLKDLFDIDLKNVRALAVWLQKLDPKTDGAARDWVAIYDECSRILYQEIDYTMEGRNADLFRKNFEGVSWVRVPKVMWDYSSAEVLVLEYVPGTKINDGEALDKLGLDRKELAKKVWDGQRAAGGVWKRVTRCGSQGAGKQGGQVAWAAGCGKEGEANCSKPKGVTTCVHVCRWCNKSRWELGRRNAYGWQATGMWLRTWVARATGMQCGACSEGNRVRMFCARKGIAAGRGHGHCHQTGG